MPFSDFHGNAETVRRVREMMARDHFPHGVILAGPRGSGKYTLAQMIAKAMNCLEKPVAGGLPDFCGRCRNCERIAEADSLEQRCDEAVEAREQLRETDKRETRIMIQTHPDVLVIPPDPPQMLVKVDQVRQVTGQVYYRPTGGGHKVYIFSEAAFMKEAANALLKVLEEPPEYATIFLLADNANSLLPTIRSRCITLQLAPLAFEEIERDLAYRTEWTAAQKKLVARLSAGALGRARRFDLNAYLSSRNDALTLLTTALLGDDHSGLFRATESYRAGGEGKVKTDYLIATLYSLLQDMLFLKHGTPELVRNIDIQQDLATMSKGVSFEWIAAAAGRLGEVQAGMRRNLLRSLSLDAFSAALES
ncbi:MAG TPA: DNA polymerase III subunit delta' [Clostridia bacterium]|nr:DNA polymerase III subunit delta' [Clostridia bacterium]